jgi:N-acylneuraminate cytidylyltransferase
MNPDFVENGACYTISREQYDLTRNRLGGKIGLVEMPEESLTEIDEPSDFHIVEMLLENRLRKSKLREIYPVVLVLDVDGVFTDAKVTYRPEMEFSKTFSMRDGKGLELVRKAGVDVVVITSEDSPIVRQRMKKLNIENVFHGVKDKYAILDNYIDENNLNWKNIAYIGDDVNDLACMLAAGLSLAPFDATSIIRSKADLVLHAEGGTGAIREATDLIISLSQRK